MKSNFKLLQQSMLFCLLGLSIILTSCGEKDLNKETSELLCGDWKVTSFTTNGEENIGSNVTKFDMEFDCEMDNTGEAEWNIFFVGGGPPRFIGGDYEIKLDGRELELAPYEFDIELNGDRLELNGNVDGERWEIEAKRD